jgi:hypothetical protein
LDLPWALTRAHIEVRPNRFDSLHSEIYFGFEYCDLEFICDLSFVIWYLNNYILEWEELSNRFEICKLHIEHHTN